MRLEENKNEVASRDTSDFEKNKLQNVQCFALICYVTIGVNLIYAMLNQCYKSARCQKFVYIED